MVEGIVWYDRDRTILDWMESAPGVAEAGTPCVRPGTKEGF